MDFMNIILRFEVDKLDNDWVEAQWREDFTEEADLPPDFDDSENYAELFDELSDWVKRWAEMRKKGQGEAGGKYWRELVDNNITPKALVAFISSFLKGDVKDLRECRACEPYSAARAYLSLLAIEGGSVFNVFHPELFRKTLEIFKLLNDLSDKTGLAAAKRGRKRRESAHNEEEGDQEEGLQRLTDDEVQERLPVLIEILDALLLAINNGFELRAEQDALTLITLTLVPFVKLEKNSTTFLNNPPRRDTFTLFVYLVYETLRSLCQPCHGDMVDVVRQIANSFMSILSFSSKEFGNEDEKVKNVVRTHVTTFLIRLLTSLGQSTNDVFKSIVQSLCITCPDKADGRAKCVQHIVSFLYDVPYDVFCWSLLWIISLCQSDSFKNRITGVEIIVKVLHTEERKEQSADDVIAINHEVLLTCLIGRFEDNSPVVRAKCLSAFCGLVLSSDRRIRGLMEALFVTPYESTEGLIDRIDSSERRVFQFQKYFKRRDDTQLNPDAILPGGTIIFNTIEKFVGDEKVNVSRSALNTMCNIFRLNSKWITSKRINLLLDYCRASSVMIRKMLVQALTDILLVYPNNVTLIRAWVLAIVPLVGDNERRSVDKVFEVSSTVILDNLVPFESIRNDDHLLPLKILRLILECNYRHHFGVICQQWSSENKFTKHFIKTVKTYIGTEHNLSAWFLIVTMSEQQNISADFIAEYYLENIHSNNKLDESTCMLVMEALDLNATQLKEYRDNLADKLWTELTQFSLPLPLISPSMNVMFKFNSDIFRHQKSPHLISTSASYLKRKSKSNSLAKIDENVLCQYIFTLGEAALFDGKIVDSETVDILKKLLEKNKSSDATDDSSVTSKVKAVTVTTLTKFCLQDQIVAKTIVPIFGNLLDSSTPSCIKINTLVAFTDLCIRFTSLIEPYLGDVCLCLKDELNAVRKKTLTLIMQLSQEDYIKLRFPYFYYILTMLLDDDESISYQTSSFIKNAVLIKNNKIMSQEIIQAIYFFNDDPERSKGVILSTQERESFCLPGQRNKEKRRQVLRYMVDHMKELSKLRIAAMIAEEIIEPVSEGKVSLSGRGADNLQDALFILSCDEFKIRAPGAGRDDNEDEEGRESEARAFQMSLLKEVLQRTLLDGVLPALIKLKKKLVEMKSPLVHDTMHALKEIVKDYKKEVNELFSGDLVTAAELEVELRSHLVEEDEEALQSPPAEIVPQDVVLQTIQATADMFMEEENSTGTPDSAIIEVAQMSRAALARPSPGSRRNSKAVTPSPRGATAPTPESENAGSGKRDRIASGMRSSSSCSSSSPVSPKSSKKKKKKRRT